MFSLEAIKAKHGDCLLLHWGSGNNHKVALIDGGPDTVYTEFLKPRLKQLVEEGGKRKLHLTMVSHADDDHINGILALARDIQEGDAPVDIGLLWHNSLEGLSAPANPSGTLPSPGGAVLRTVLIPRSCDCRCVPGPVRGKRAGTPSVAAQTPTTRQKPLRAQDRGLEPGQKWEPFMRD